jgi:hypothetical protein
MAEAGGNRSRFFAVIQEVLNQQVWDCASAAVMEIGSTGEALMDIL